MATVLISREEALGRLLDGARLLGTERVPIANAAGSVLAEDFYATRDQPPFPLSAMDGYAVRESDAFHGARLQVIGEAPAGAPFSGSVQPGQAVRIVTGGVVPSGADRIVIQEYVRRDGNDIEVIESAESPFVREAGGDFRVGDKLVAKGEWLTPAHVGLIAATGTGQVSVAKRPRVVIIPSGDELREPGEAAETAAIYNSAAYSVAALVEQWGGLAIRHAILPDDRALIYDRLAAAVRDADIVVPLGGASVGDRDLLRPAFERAGAILLFDRVAVVPGKPSWHARFPSGPLVLGLPGNPASAFVCAHLFLAPLLAALSGKRMCPQLQSGRLLSDVPANGEREAFFRGKAALVDGSVQVEVFAHQDSSLQVPLAAANALVRREAHAPSVSAGTIVQFLQIGGL